MSNSHIPTKQTAALVRQQGQPVEFVHDYPVGKPGHNEILAKVLYTGVCQSDLHTMRGTAASHEGKAITNIKLPHVGGHEGIGRIVQIGPDCGDDIKIGQLVGVRFTSRICRRCDFCLAGKDQYCLKSTNHLHHEDGAFQEYIVLDAGALSLLPDDIDPKVMGPVLCAGTTAYNGSKQANIKPGDFVVVSGAGGGIGHLAVQYAHARGGRVIAIDSSKPASKAKYIKSIPGVTHFVPFDTFSSAAEMISHVKSLTRGGLGVDSALVCAGSSAVPFTQAALMLRIEGTIVCCGIPPPDLTAEKGMAKKDVMQISVGEIAIKGLDIKGVLTGNSKDCLEAVELVRLGLVKPKIIVREFKDLEQIYGEMERGEIVGRIVVKVAKDE